MTRKRGRSWLADWRDGRGRRHRPTFQTHEQAREAEDRGRQDARRSRGLRSFDPTLAEYADLWFAAKRPFLKPSTVRLYGQSLRLHLLPALGHLQLRALARRDIKAMLAAKLGEGLKRSTVKMIVGVLNTVLAAAREEEILLTNPASSLGRELKLWPGSREATERIRAMTPGQLDRFLVAATGSASYPLWFTMSRTGLRLNEALGLQWGDLDLEAREARIQRAYSNDRRVDTPKAGHGRTVDLAASVVDVLRQHRAALTERWLAEPLKRGHTRGVLPQWIFVEAGSTWRPWHHETARGQFIRAVRKAGLPHFSPHSLRHTYASQLLAVGVSPAYVQEQLGHASIEMTVRVYGRWLRKRVPGAVDLLDGQAAEARRAAVAVGPGVGTAGPAADGEGERDQ